MKKTLLTLVVFLTGLTTSAADTNKLTFTTSSSVISGTTLYGVKFNLGSNEDGRYTVSPSSLEIPKELTLESIALTTNAAVSGTYYLYVMESGGTLVAVSQASKLGLAAGGKASFNFSDVTTAGDKRFDNALTLSTSKSYIAYFATESALSSFEIGSAATANATTSINIKMGRSGDYDAAKNSEWGVIATNSTITNNRTPYTPEMTITTRLIPEPTTATLSLLALAGLVARRRRR